MSKLFDISAWSEQRWWNTGGTRNKKIFLNPADNLLYYFKESLKKEGRDYRYEFWSEVIASEVGIMCGFNVLPYHAAIHENAIGCLSQSMINQEKEELVEGGKYIQAFDNTFNPDDRKLRKRYGFDLIMSTIEAFKVDKYKNEIIETLVFDALIGNSDRHQENWAFITEHSTISKSLKEMEYDLEYSNLGKLPKWFENAIRKIYLAKGSTKLKPEFKKVKLLMAKSARFAPIYDSGCSFGRELSEEKVRLLLSSETELQKYVKKGESEIHWEQKKLSHFDLLKKIQEKYKEEVNRIIRRIVEKFDESKINLILENIDKEVPEKFKEYKIPPERKALIIKMVILRKEKLNTLLQ